MYQLQKKQYAMCKYNNTIIIIIIQILLHTLSGILLSSTGSLQNDTARNLPIIIAPEFFLSLPFPWFSPTLAFGASPPLAGGASLTLVVGL